MQPPPALRTPTRSLRALAATALAVGLVGATPALAVAATSRYVSTGGSDSSDGSQAHPWRSLQHAADVATAGTTVQVSAGSYSGFRISRSGASGSPIVFQPASGAAVTVAGGPSGDTIQIAGGADYVTISGLTVTGAASGQHAGINVFDGSDRISIDHNLVRDNSAFGIDVSGSTNVSVTDNEIRGNAVGLQINRSASGDLIARNRVHDQNKMMINDSAPGNDTGAVAINFLHTTGPLLATGNVIYANRAASHDYTWDGSGFEIYGASGITMQNNTLYNNATVLETGQSSSDGGCNNNRFDHNIAWGGLTSSSYKALGLQLRCARNMLVANNDLYNLNDWTYWIETRSQYAANIDGLRVLNNIALQNHALIYAMSGMPSSVTIDYNDDYTTSPYAKTDAGQFSTLAAVQTALGIDRHSVYADPKFINPSTGNYSLQAGSPAIDRGTSISGVTTSYAGSAPDIGDREYR
jgi:parallel beta-helix repeat protein